MAPDEMLVMYGKAVGGELPSRIADLLSAAIDVQFAQAAFERVANEKDELLTRALWEAGVIAYRRGFTSGRALLAADRSRTRVPSEIVENLEPPLQEIHASILEAANKHVAHRVDDRELLKVILLLSNPVVARGVLGVTHIHARYVAPPAEEARDAGRLAELIRTEIEAAVKDLEEALVAEATKTDIAALYDGATPMG
jgi:hypothetical protein